MLNNIFVCIVKYALYNSYETGINVSEGGEGTR